jgi:hypothetical protein
MMQYGQKCWYDTIRFNKLRMNAAHNAFICYTSERNRIRHPKISKARRANIALRKRKHMTLGS